MAIRLSGNAGRDDRLKSWKEIAAFFGTDERTVRRWEQRGLPVYRVPGGGRATVYAERAEVQAWLQGRELEDEGPAVAVPARQPLHRPARYFRLLLVTALAVGAGFLAFRTGTNDAPAVAAHQPSQRAVDLQLAGTYEFERRTAASLEKARELFGRAIAEDPAYAAPYAGLANTYLLLREFSAMADTEAYERARVAAERALAIDPQLADAHAALAFVDFYALQDWSKALAGFQRAVALKPAAARARHWHATALLHAGRFREALAEINEAASRDPGSRSIRADRALILYYAGRMEEALADLREMSVDEPEFVSPHHYLAMIYLGEGQLDNYLREARMAAELRRSPDHLALVAEAERGFRANASDGLFRALLGEQLRQRQAGRGSNFALAGAYAKVGDRESALRSLEVSLARREALAVGLRIEPMLAGLRKDPDFQRLAEEVGRVKME